MAKGAAGYGEATSGFLSEQEWALKVEERRLGFRAKVLAELKRKFDLPKEFEALAVDIWFDGKED